jgi:acyl-coenzyme A synthetase/AMP-(fatty) acid ligase
MDLIRRLVGRHVAQGRGDRVCYVDPDVGEVSYAQLYAAARRYAAALRDGGVRQGTRGLVVSDDSVAAVVAVLGMWWHGCIPVPVNPMLRESEITFIAKDCAAGLVHLDVPAKKGAVLRKELTAVDYIEGERVRVALRSERPEGSGRPADIGGTDDVGEPAELPASEEILLQYTSGSTGPPKGVRSSPTGIEAVLAGFGSILDLSPDDVVLSTAKLSFSYGLGNSLLFPLAAGARAVLISGAVDQYVVAAQLRRHRPTVLCSVPRVYARLLDLAAEGSAVAVDSVRLAVSAAEHLPAELSERFIETFGVPLINALGTTEVGHIVLATRPSQTEPGSTGYPVPGVTVTVRDDAGRALPDGCEGRLHVASASIALGYLDRPEATRRTFADGGVYTSDIVRRTAKGDIRHLCRVDDMLNLGGFKISPAEIESVMRKADGLEDCAVVAEVDRDGLEQAVAYAVPSAGVDGDNLRRAIMASFRTHLPLFRRPTRIEVLDKLPINYNGKLTRSKLRVHEEQPKGPERA